MGWQEKTWGLIIEEREDLLTALQKSDDKKEDTEAGALTANKNKMRIRKGKKETPACF